LEDSVPIERISTSPTHAIVRAPGNTYPSALTRQAPRPPIDLELARAQHAAYVVALRKAGLEVTELAADNEHADAVFVQDRVCVLDDQAIVGRSAVESRRGEEAAIVEVLGRFFSVVELPAPACLDWGDVLVAEDRIFVGLSERSNRVAVDRLRETLAPRRRVEGVDLPPELLHLLSGCAYLGEGSLLAVDALASFACANGFRVVPVPAREQAAANVLVLGDDVIMPSGYPETEARIARAEKRVRAVSVGEFEKRDGGVTCLSILY
jgi:dimethylargininase